MADEQYAVVSHVAKVHPNRPQRLNATMLEKDGLLLKGSNQISADLIANGA